MTNIHAGPIGPDGFGGAYPNETETDRAAWWHAMGGRQGILAGFNISTVSGQMALDVSTGAALIGERAASGNVSLNRGYLAWSEGVTRVSFDPASVAARVDALVCAVADIEEGAPGTAALIAGGHLVAVPGVSGTDTPRTDAQINAFLGRGGFHRLADVAIAAGDTSIGSAGIARTAFRINGWNALDFNRSTGWAGLTGRYMLRGPEATVEITGTYTGPTLTADTGGNIPDAKIGDGFPSQLRPSDNAVYDRFVRNGLYLGSWRINPDGNIHITDAYPTTTITSGSAITFRAKYDIDQG